MPLKGGARPKATLKFHPDLYTPAGAQELTEKELRQEYSRLRSIARKRLERFKGTEWETTQMYKQYKEGFPTLREIGTNKRELYYAFSEVARFISSAKSSVSGLKKSRKTTIKTLQERGYSFVNAENYKKFVDFMEYVRTANLGRIFDSKTIAEFYDFEEKKHRTQKELRKAFRTWTTNQRPQNIIQNKSKKDSEQYRKALE